MHEENLTQELEKLKLSAIDCYRNEQFEALPKILRSMIDLGSAWALHYLAGCYTYGHGVETDIEEANRLHLEAANLGFSDAQMTIGNHLLSGYGVEKDVEKGIYFLKLSSDQGNGYASFLLGNFFIIAGEQDAEKYPEAIRYFRKGADQGDHRAMQRLAWALSNGRVVEKNEEEALSLNVKAADLGNQTAAYNAAGAFRYGYGTPTDCNKAISYYEIAANFGMMEAMHNLGTMYFNAEGISKDIEKANHWYLKAANLGSGLSSLCLGLISEQGTRGPADNAFAFAWFSVAAAQGNIEAQKKIESLSKTLIDEEIKRAIFLLNAFCERGFSWAQQALGSIYFSGDLVASDDSLAFKWLNAAAEQGLARAQWGVGTLYGQGIGVDKDYSKSFDWISKSAGTGFAPALLSIGICFEQGLGTEENMQEAATYYLAASEQGELEALYRLSLLFSFGKGVSQNPEMAIKYLKSAADKDFLPAQARLGECFMRGHQVEQDLQQAVHYLEMAAEKIDPQAMNSLGMLYASGSGVELDAQKAFILFEKAAKLGLASAQGNLARSYEAGIGTEQNIEEAFRLYKLASNQAHPANINKSAYTNWIAKTQECGLTNEQACGLAMLYAWTLTRRDSAEDTADTETFWTFIDQEDFNEIKKDTFSFEDFASFVPELKLAGEILRVEMPESRLDAIGKPANILNMEWPEKPKDGADINSVLSLRYRFDMLWCQKVGECLRREIRTPRQAYVFADYVADGFRQLDPEGFTRILNKLLYRKSPLVGMFSDKYQVKNTNGFEGYEPFQIALTGFMANQDNRLGESLWNIQRMLFYKQPGGDPINLEKQCLNLNDFLDFATPLVTSFVNKQKSSYFDVSALMASEYLLRSADKDQQLEQLDSLMQGRYGFSSDNENESLHLRLLLNAAAFFTMCCLHIKNLTNQIANFPTLRMLDTEGLLWSRDMEEPQPLLEEAIHCFNVMLSWRQGLAQALFLETESGFIQRAYIGEESKREDILSVFSKICVAYNPIRCVIAYMSEDDPSPVTNLINTKVIFLSIGRDGEFGLNIFRTDENLDRCQLLGEYLGASDDAKLLPEILSNFRDKFVDPLDSEIQLKAQADLLDLFPAPSAWQFSTSFEDEMSNHPSQDFRLLISGIERGYFWPFSQFLIQKLKVDVISLESILGIDSSAEKIWFDKYIALEDLGQVDPETSVQQQKLSADNGNPFEQNNYATHLSNLSHEESRDSVQYFLAAGHQSLPYAQVTLGWYLLHGLGGMERNVEKAFDWNMKGAIQGHPEGANNVAFQYENGIGVAPNLELAKHWYSYATIRGSVIAYGHLTALTREENEK